MREKGDDNLLRCLHIQQTQSVISVSLKSLRKLKHQLILEMDSLTLRTSLLKDCLNAEKSIRLN